MKKLFIIVTALCILTTQAVPAISTSASQPEELILCSDFDDYHPALI